MVLSLKKGVFQDLATLFLLALLVRLLTAWPQQQPNYMDAAYYYVNGVNLAEGRGFVEDLAWNYLGEPSRPPQPSHLYWMPLTSILAALSMAVVGTSYRAAQIPFIILSAVLPLISYLTAETLARCRWQSWLAALLTIFSGFYFPYWTAIDNFTPFAVTGALALWLGSRGMGQSAWALIASGVCVGLAHLARADGLLLLVAIIFIYLTRSLNKQRGRDIFYLCLGYFITITPWLIRNELVTGSPLSVAGSQTIWLTHYDDLFSYGRELSARTFLAQGWTAILQGRWWALTINLQRLLAEWLMIFLLPLLLVGLWQGRRQPLVQLGCLYAMLLFGVMTFIFAFPGARGGLFHSGAALLPFIYSVAMLGLNESVEWAAARRRQWNIPLAKITFGAGVIVLAMALSGYVYYRSVLKNNAWNNADRDYPTIAAWVNAQNPNAMVMIGNPPAYRYHGGGLSVVVPNENLTTTLRVIQRYQVDYLILDSNRPTPLAEVYSQTVTCSALSLVQTFGQTGQKIYLFAVK